MTANASTGLGVTKSGSGLVVYSMRGKNVPTNNNAQDGLIYGFVGRLKNFTA